MLPPSVKLHFLITNWRGDPRGCGEVWVTMRGKIHGGQYDYENIAHVAMANP